MANTKKKSWYNDKDAFCSTIKGPVFALCFNFFLSSWGDRMWHFAAGLYLVILSDGMLRLAAIFGFSCGTLMLIFGGIIGDWVDRNRRMKVVVTTLFIQNISVGCCAITVCMALTYETEINEGLDGNLRHVVEAIIVVLAIIAELSSMAYKIAIEKDWIVEVASGNRSLLANLNAFTRAIDLSCKILAPTVAGLIMSYSIVIAAICIAAWNAVSVFVEFALLRRVFNLVPALAYKGKDPNAPEEIKETELKDMSIESTPMKPESTDRADEPVESEPAENTPLTNGAAVDVDQGNEETKVAISGGSLTSKEQKEEDGKGKNRFVTAITGPFRTIFKGWTTYMRQNVVFAGLSLSFLYMTVLGFDCITLGYIYANGLKEFYVGISMAAAGATGIIGAFSFTQVNRRLGLEKTGLIAYSIEVFFLILAVVSIWAPGSLFDPTFSGTSKNCTQEQLAGLTTPSVATVNMASSSGSPLDYRQRRDLSMMDLYSDPADGLELSEGYTLFHGVDSLHGSFPVSYEQGSNSIYTRFRRAALQNSSSPGDSHMIYDTADKSHSSSDTECSPGGVTVSIILFIIGIVTSRVGLWMADLVVTQLIQENVVELERGIVNGVQNSLNMLNDMIKFALVIVLPKIETFGILILLSFAFICMAGCFFMGHVFRVNKDILLCKDDTTRKEVTIAEVIAIECPPNTDEDNNTTEKADTVLAV